MDQTTIAPEYRLPPGEIAAILDAPTSPDISVDPGGRWMLVLTKPSLPPISELARPELRLAGLRIDPGANGLSRSGYYTGLTLVRISDGLQRPVTGLPPEARIAWPRWAPDGGSFAFGVRDGCGIRLWLANVDSGVSRRVSDIRLNGVFGAPFAWIPSGQGREDVGSLIVRAVLEDPGEIPVAPAFPVGPEIRENAGQLAPSRTYQDLLKGAHDEALFETYAASRLVVITSDGNEREVGAPGTIRRAEPAPGGAFLLVETLHRPFSYLVPHYRFPVRVEVRDRVGRVVRELVDAPLAENVPVAFDAVPEGPRSFRWRNDAEATVCWVEAQDGGDPSVATDVRDRVYALSEPFEGAPALLQSLEFRYAGLTWGDGATALVTERWWKTRRTRTWRFAPDAETTDRELLFDRSWEDRYRDPGTPLLKSNPAGRRVLLTGDGGRHLFLAGGGASPDGDFPFMDRLDLNTKATKRLWQCEPPYYERPVKLIGETDCLLLTLRESAESPPNVFLRALKSGGVRQLTAFPHPAPRLSKVRKEIIHYRRADGIGMNGTLYLPPGYSDGQGPLPLLMWAYPREFKNADAAGQVTGSPYRFTPVTWTSPLPWLTQGYAVLDGPTMPIVGQDGQEANDSYVTQLVSSAEAAVEEVVRRGVADRNRIAIGGHSYGGFMTANLLAHCDLFRAGIARSGAYNRTLTPFGFQSEERTFWQAPEVYFAMSAFMHADKIRAPLLLIHGHADNNSGTFPMQSERLYNALKGHGATTRLVMLPHESHGYRARESVMHVFWEMTEWLARYLKNREGGSIEG